MFNQVPDFHRDPQKMSVMRKYYFNNSPVYEALKYDAYKNPEGHKFFHREEKEPGIISITLEEGFELRMKQLVIDSLDSEGYDLPEDTIREKLKLVLSEFQRVSLYRNNIMKVGRRNAFYEYLLGVPGIISLPIYYYDIYNVLQELTGVDLREGPYKDKISGPDVTEFFYYFVERALNQVLKDNGLPQLDNLKIID